MITTPVPAIRRNAVLSFGTAMAGILLVVILLNVFTSHRVSYLMEIQITERSSGLPLKGVQVSLQRMEVVGGQLQADNGPIYSLSTGDDGVFNQSLQPGYYYLKATYDQYASAEAVVYMSGQHVGLMDPSWLTSTSLSQECWGDSGRSIPASQAPCGTDQLVGYGMVLTVR